MLIVIRLAVKGRHGDWDTRFFVPPPPTPLCGTHNRKRDPTRAFRGAFKVSPDGSSFSPVLRMTNKAVLFQR